MPEPANSALDDARKRARRRLVGAIVLALGAAVIVPLFLESDTKPLGPDVQVQIPAIDEAKFQNRLTPPGKPSSGEKSAPDKSPAEKVAAEKTPPDKAAMPGARSTGVIGEPSLPNIADATAAKASAEPAKASAESAKSTSESAAPASKPAAAAPAQPVTAAPATAAKGSTPTGDSTAKTLARDIVKDGTRDAAKSAAAKQADLKKPAPPAKKAPEPEPATNLGTATLNTASPAAKSPGEFVVQVGAFADRSVATDLAAKAGEQGYPVFLEPVTTKSGPIQRVRVGPFSTRAEADQAAAKLAAAGFTAVARPR